MFESVRSEARRALLALVALCALGMASGCGGDGAGAGGSAATDGGSVAEVVVMTDKPTLPGSDGTLSAVITAQVKDATNNVLPNQRVTFASADAGVALSPVGTSTLTDAAGRTQVRLELGDDAAARTNRTVTVTATVGAITRATTVQVIGTRLALTGPSSLAVGASAEYTVAATDGSGAGIVGLPVRITFTGGTPATSDVVTAAGGQAKVTLTGTVAGAGRVAANAAGSDPVTLSVQVQGADTPFRVVSPADAAEVDVGASQSLVVQYRPNGAPVAGAAVTLSATRGTVNGGSVATVATNASGEAAFTIRSMSAGTSTVTAVVGAGGSTLSTSSRLRFVSRVPASVSLSPDPTSIGANAPGSSSSTSRLVATVRDLADNPVTGASVAFSAIDPSGGRIEPGLVVTDAEGQAVASFFAGPNSTGPDAVQVTATVLDATGRVVDSDVRPLTVSAVALFVELGTGNSIEALGATAYSMPWTAIVTDANRNPVQGVRVTASLTALNYFKGIWVWNGTSHSPTRFDAPGAPAVACPSEDTNGNNLLDASEDVNGNGRLDPGSPASVLVSSSGGQTGADGLAMLSIVYPKSFGGWVEVRLRVTIGTPGTESSIYRIFMLPLLSADVTSETTSPPSVGSRTPNDVTPPGALTGPYGYAPSCTVPD